MLTELKVANVKCVDDGETKGVIFACGEQGRTLVTLVFDKTTAHKQTDDLARLLEKMKLAEVTVQTPLAAGRPYFRFGPNLSPLM